MLYYRTYTIKQNKNGSSLKKKKPKKKRNWRGVTSPTWQVDKIVFTMYFLKCLIFHHTPGVIFLELESKKAQGFGNQYWKTYRIKQQKTNKREWERKSERRETENILKTHLSAQMQINWCCFLKSMEASARNTASFDLNFKVSQVNFLLMRKCKTLKPLFVSFILWDNCKNKYVLLLYRYSDNYCICVFEVSCSRYFHNKIVILDLSGG